ncbi:hypothetical protein [Mucilaginibacter sp. HD30]
MRYAIWSITCLLSVTTFYSCKKAGTAPNSINDKDPVVYIAGTVWDDVNKKYSAFVLKDEALSLLNNSDESAAVLGMTVQGSDIYLTGYLKKPSDKDRIACYWKNGIRTPVDIDRDFGSSAVDIVVGNNIVYTCGFKNGSAVYWKNESSFNAARSSSGRDNYNAIAINNSDFYIGGNYTNPVTFKSIPAYWKNDVLVNLPAPDGHHGIVNGIASKGNDVYAVGYTLEFDGKNEVATYWKNGIAVKLGDGSVPTTIKSIAIEGNDVYMVGTVDRKTMVCWKNDKILLKDLTAAQESTYPTDIYIYKNDVYITGSIYINNINTGPLYWKNSERHIINNIALKGGTGYGIAVLPQ